MNITCDLCHADWPEEVFHNGMCMPCDMVRNGYPALQPAALRARRRRLAQRIAEEKLELNIERTK